MFSYLLSKFATFSPYAQEALLFALQSISLYNNPVFLIVARQRSLKNKDAQMITDKQVSLLFSAINQGNTMEAAAAKAEMSVKTARKLKSSL